MNGYEFETMRSPVCARRSDVRMSARPISNEIGRPGPELCNL